MHEYLVNHGKNGGFGRFASAAPLHLARGERVIVRGARGLELGTVLCPASPKHQLLLADTPVGELLRCMASDDEQQVSRLHKVEAELFQQARALTSQMQLPVEIIDVEVLFGGEQAVLHHLAWADCDLQEFVAALTEATHLNITFDNPPPTAGEEGEEEHGGCGQPGCGRASGGGCSSCGSGGCSSCGSGGVDMREYFAHLRTKMEEQHARTPLL